ncbi:FAD-dependent oxidoreductase [Mycobacteroides salmoniphilum]|uniref:Putative epoxidase LasC n=1 Tax=Mycobacteroides salmoniphilum TaxID=404941 RepID=A0A4V3I0V7_9MYCO|nr:FAD-dependent oxidoreductase [Mycobacteroides salmoniphilum]TDZ94388.1 putative epoxidase LasC [Mycobacteroides salmoniphilum]TEA03827.1 putative epoxidase LasC [Mycobacteroides salmoniphilum]
MTPETREHRDHAVVLGAGMAGLLAARVLSESYASVTVVERDELGADATARTGVRQGQHIHMFMSSGTEALEQLFPGILAELRADGATVCDEGDLSRVRMLIGPHEMFNRSEKFSDPGTFKLYLTTRPFLESHVRQNVRLIDNVRFLDGHDVIEPMTEEHRVTGVRVARRSTGLVTTLIADLVVDATGRTPRTQTFLDRLGCERPAEVRMTSPVTYASQLLHLPDDVNLDKLTFFNPAPEHPHGGAIARCENGTVMMTLGKFNQDEPPTTFAEMISFAEQFVPTELLDTVRSAVPIGDVHTYRYREAVWRRYDQIQQFPEGLLVIGDAICSLDPIKGQGMTMALVEAVTLRDCLIAGDAELARRYFGAVGRRINAVWQQNKMAAPLFTGTPANASVTQRIAWRLLAWWALTMMSAAREDIRITETILRVSHLHDSPSLMRRPAFLLRVLRHGRRRHDVPVHVPQRQFAVSGT